MADGRQEKRSGKKEENWAEKKINGYKKQTSFATKVIVIRGDSFEAGFI